MSEEQETAEVPEGGGSVSFERVRLYLERHPEMFNLAGEIDFHDGYVGEDWPRRGYALARKDIEQILDDADTAEAEHGEAQQAFNNLSEQKKQWAKDHAEVDRLRMQIHSMRLNGAQHGLRYGYQKYIEGQGWVNHCAICRREEGHPAHFGSKAKYLDSREVEKAAQSALERLETALTGLGLKTTAQELLRGLPGIPEPVLPEEGEQVCKCPGGGPRPAMGGESWEHYGKGCPLRSGADPEDDAPKYPEVL